MKNKCVIGFLIIFGWACEPNNTEKITGPENLIGLELVDSLVVNETEVLTMDDYSAENELFLLRGTKTRKLYLADKKGLILNEYMLDKSLGGVGYRFLDKNRWVAQSWDRDFYVYTLEGKKVMEAPSIHTGLTKRRVYTYRTTFTPYLNNGIPKIIGEEPNTFDPDQVNSTLLGSVFYSKIKTVYDYNLYTNKTQWLVTYPETWVPFLNKQFVGTSFPMIAFDRKSKELALLPVIGNQLFVYDYADSIPVLKHEVPLIHRFRPKTAPVLDKEENVGYSDYPFFTDLRIAGKYILVGFHTRIPDGIITQMKLKNGDYQNQPAYQAAQKQFNKPYYLIIKDGKQIGVLEDLPVQGSLNFIDEEGYLYINDNVSPEGKRGYNVFFKIKIKD